ncbi:tRNA pseudouridine(38-40) synthase TruA [Deinococcus irradiatisoli]|uniref:tRNA pseudouridine synthase A n=1 Tax=Deinococcus irradiatisoli TaxID=2202254 RepID=A0A2Z3JA29_9DEIO|nr:tRNA pseudouridine(38-40) synthase TruA [Deinococcus irradiatisoli]AWN21852.1 tRNA pseudouridine(38-40) synthase TruA [Deinococcus irradiatisoli]
MFGESAGGEQSAAGQRYRPPEGFGRWRLELSWNGAGFVGWQSQPGQRSVQDSLWAALQALATAPEDVARPVAAGRTDAGVHAEAMTTHVDVRAGQLRPPPHRLARAINAHLPPDVAVTRFSPAAPGFHARFSCLQRAYVYRVVRAEQRLPLWEGRALRRSGPLDVTAMRLAAASLLGEHDFAAFATQEERQTVRRLDRLEIVEDGPLLEFQVAGESFLRHMVRGLIGTLLRVGEGQQRPEAVVGILASRQRSQAGANVPAHGLYFSGAVYSDTPMLPEASTKNPV